MKNKLYIFICCFCFILSCKNEASATKSNTVVKKITKEEKNAVKNIGDTLDIFNGIPVFYNKSINNTSGRNIAKNRYNLGLKWQCVEFVKRYYYVRLKHEMPNSYGHAKDFFNSKIKDGQLNRDRNLVQYTNRSKTKPMVNDLLVFDGNVINPYGHVAIISKVTDDGIEIVQQNVGKNSRDTYKLKLKNKLWSINNNAVLGWLRKEDK